MSDQAATLCAIRKAVASDAAAIENLYQELVSDPLIRVSGIAREAAHAFFRRCGFASDTKHAFVKYRRQFATA